MTGAQFEISIDGVPRTYRDQKDLALLAAQILKSKNPNSVVKLKDLKSGEERSDARAIASAKRAPDRKPGGAGSSQRVNPTRCRACTGVFPGAGSQSAGDFRRPTGLGKGKQPPAKGRGRPTFLAGQRPESP